MEATWKRALADAVARKIPTALYATLGGDHLRGLAVAGSPHVVTGAMVLPLRDVLGLRPIQETRRRQVSVAGRDVTLVFDDVRHALDLLARTSNTQRLEELFSPHVVLGGEEHERLKTVARGFVSRACFHDFRDRAAGQRRLLESRQPAGVAHLLEAARLCLAGARVLRTGVIESDLRVLLEEEDEGWILPFLRRHAERGEAATLEPEELGPLAAALDRLEHRLGDAREVSRLPDGGGSITQLDELLVELRLRGVAKA